MESAVSPNICGWECLKISCKKCKVDIVLQSPEDNNVEFFFFFFALTQPENQRLLIATSVDNELFKYT